MLSVALSWTGHLDQLTQNNTSDAFKRALTTAALARGLNGLISVAQGTEIAIAPVGIGVTLTVGEILDPLNDLVERFSWLALMASVSLGLQIAMSEIASSVWASGLLSVAVVAYLGVLWFGRSQQIRALAARFLATFLCLRFLLAIVMLFSHWVDTTFLAEHQAQAVAQLSHTSSTLEQMQEQTETSQLKVDESQDGFFDRTADQLGAFLTNSSQSLDLKTQLKELQSLVEQSVEEIVNLIVIFLLQTIVIPIATLWVCLRGVGALWRRFLVANGA